MWEYSQTTCEEKQICLQETGGREEALCWMWTKLSSALWRYGGDQQDPFSPSTVAAAELRCQRRQSLSSKKNVFVKTWWSNFCPLLQSVDSLRSGNVATLLKIGQTGRELWIVRSLVSLNTNQFTLSFQMATVQVLPNLSLLTSITVNEWTSRFGFAHPLLPSTICDFHWHFSCTCISSRQTARKSGKTVEFVYNQESLTASVSVFVKMIIAME